MSELSELIKINKNIEKQNTEIIRLLKIIAGESDFVDRSGYVFPDFDEEDDESEDIFDNFDSLLENEIGVGELYFIDGDIYRYSVKNNEGMLDNLMGGEVTTTFDMAQNISRESIKRNQSIDDNTVILTSSSKDNLPKTLQVCHEQGAEKVFIPWNQMMELLGAPERIQTILKLNFYRTEDELIKKLFEE